ncbi:uncharacterized protein LOC144874326 isoform X3 [Branchiostoma floridae x Branchiostoma japonicum]
MSFSQYSDDPGRASYHAGASGRDSSSEFTRLTQSVSSNVQKITSNVSQVQRMVNQLGTAQDTHELRDKLHQMQHYTNQLAKDTNKYLKDLSNLPSPSSQSEQKQRKMQRERLTNDFSTALNNFQTVQRRAAEKERESVSRARANSGLPPVSNASPNPFDDDVRTSDGQLIAFDGNQGGSSMTAQMMEEESNLEMIRERETNIRQLEADIMDVNSIFKDLATMVHEQGEMIDSIEANVESAAIHVESGNQQLRQASDYQKKNTCIYSLLNKTPPSSWSPNLNLQKNFVFPEKVTPQDLHPTNCAVDSGGRCSPNSLLHTEEVKQQLKEKIPTEAVYHTDCGPDSVGDHWPYYLSVCTLMSECMCTKTHIPGHLMQHTSNCSLKKKKSRKRPMMFKSSEKCLWHFSVLVLC